MADIRCKLDNAGLAQSCHCNVCFPKTNVHVVRAGIIE
jgi:hypothetical protein